MDPQWPFGVVRPIAEEAGAETLRSAVLDVEVMHRGNGQVRGSIPGAPRQGATWEEGRSPTC